LDRVSRSLKQRTLAARAVKSYDLIKLKKNCPVNIKRIVTIVLSIFVATSIVYLIATEVRKPEKNETASEGTRDNPASMENHTLTVYYFHTTFRCPTCRKIETLTESTVKNFFSAELAQKKIIWKPVNIEVPENRHFADDYKLFTKSVVIVDSANGRQLRWKNLDKIWELVRDESDFTGYINKEITGYLKGI
jgi:hypothetical protein